MRRAIEFTLNGERVSLAEEDPARPLLSWLRETRGLTGAKEGCAEGDCGACTVALVEPEAVRPIASCIALLGAMDGRTIVTVEHLAAHGRRHPAQEALLDCHGSQCGFCTPGVVMALYAHYESGGAAERAALCDALAGNLCRCTGYAPILAAGLAMGTKPAPARTPSRSQSTLSIERGGRRFFAPTTLAELSRWLLAHPQARLLAGGTDLALEVTKELRDLECIAYLGKVGELKEIRETDEALELGAAVTYAEAFEALARLHPDVRELVRRLGGAQVRAMGTIAGNIANASPIGDTMPMLLALGCTLVLRRGESERRVPLEDFYTGYRKTVLAPGEFIRSVRIEKPRPGARFAAYKLSKRFDQDISTVCAAFHVTAEGRARFGFGGMAATPARAARAEAAWPRGVEPACAALAEDFAPISDHRGSASYRLAAAQALLRKFAGGIGPRALLELGPVA
ncbi:MAG: xanthine dehydrogenase small subunit [Burkholderiales bacterium]|nr:xanthine dehydrogenase small subunit [Burkholderiales bacterium]